MLKLLPILAALLSVTAFADAKQLCILALGDSYTIGQGVNKNERWPEQLAQTLRAHGIDIAPPETIAQSGWTSGNVLFQIQRKKFDTAYDLVTIMVGANDQFQNRNTDFFRTDLAQLIQGAVSLAGGDPDKVLLFSIPDWGRSPYARGQDAEAISKEIDRYNAIIIALAKQNKIEYIDITELSRNGSGPSLFVEDGLHPSAKIYSSWVVSILPHVIGILKK